MKPLLFHCRPHMNYTLYLLLDFEKNLVYSVSADVEGHAYKSELKRDGDAYTMEGDTMRIEQEKLIRGDIIYDQCDELIMPNVGFLFVWSEKTFKEIKENYPMFNPRIE